MFKHDKQLFVFTSENLSYKVSNVRLNVLEQSSLKYKETKYKETKQPLSQHQIIRIYIFKFEFL